MNIQQLRERYAAPEIPKCRVCGGELTVQRAGGGPTVWGCTGMIDDPTGERNWIYAEGRSCADEHYERSRWSDYSKGGDADVIELIDALEAAEREHDELKRIQELNIKIKQAMHERFTRAEAELARRDAAAGEPVAVISVDSLTELKESYRPVLAFRPDHKRNSQGIPLYTAAPPAVLASEVEELSMLIRRLVHSLKNSNPDSALLKSVPDYMRLKGFWKVTDCLRGDDVKQG